MQKLFSICCLFLCTNVFSQQAAIKVVKDTSFQIADFISFWEKDTTETFTFIRQKYFSTSKVLIGVVQKNCTDKAENPPYSLVGPYFRIDFCLAKSGRIYFPELTMLDKNYPDENTIVRQLKDLGYTPAYPHKEKKTITTEYRMADDYNEILDKCVTLSVKKKKITGITFETKQMLPGLKRKPGK